MEKEILRLFKGFLGQKNDIPNKDVLKYGLLIPSSATETVVKEAINLYGKDGQQWNNTLHKDFEIVRNAPLDNLITQQLMHYITTYGFEALGVYSEETIYIPKEKLDIPELDIESVDLIVIKPLTPSELTEKLMTLLTSGIALSEQSIKDIMVLSDYIDKNRFDEIKNREIKTALYDKYNIMPANPDDFLRYLLFKTTGETLKIKNNDMIHKIKLSNRATVLNMLLSYINKTPNGYARLSSIFLRNKVLFLAYKTKRDELSHNKKDLEAELQVNTIVNKLRKLSNKNHKPLKSNILDCITNSPDKINVNDVIELLDNVTIFREIRILNGILYRLYGSQNIVYKIRNGSSYVSKISEKTKNNQEYYIALDNIAKNIKEHLVDRISKKVRNKTIYIPNNVVYAAPTSEKQFTGNFPDGSYLEIPREQSLVYGVHWKNIENGISTNNRDFYGSDDYYSKYNREERVDLDLKQMNKNEVFGWDASYRSQGRDILFSGDVTSGTLPQGATELFYVDKNYGYGAFLVSLNMFTSNSQDVPFEFVIAKEDRIASNIRKNYVLDPNKILEKVEMVIKKDERQKVVGFIVIGDNVRFYFNDFSAGGVGHARYSTASQDDITMGSFEYLQSYSKIQIKLNDLLAEAGAIMSKTNKIFEVVSENNEFGETVFKTKEIDVDIDLSPNSITKESIIALLSE